MQETNLMDYSEFSVLFRKIFEQNRLECFCEDAIVRKFYDFTLLFIDANSKFNLSAIRDVPGVIAKHYADCLLVESYIPQNARVLDVGCGGGFPCIPLAIARPNLEITAIDSTQKKINFVESAASALGLKNLKTVCGRIEGKEMRHMRESFEIVTSRAVARLNILAELCLPYVAMYGSVLALKGAQGQEEMMEAQFTVQKLGGGDIRIFNKALLFDDIVEERCILQIPKEMHTMRQYPRAYATIRKNPL